MERFYRHADERDFFTLDRQPDREEVTNAASAHGKHSMDPVGSRSGATPQPLTTKP